MKLKQIEQCKSLDFEPFLNKNAWALPLAYQDVVFNAKGNQALDLELSLEETLFKAFPALSCVDAGRLYHALKNSGIKCDWEKLFTQHQLKWSEDLENLFLVLKGLPNNFLKWAAQKDLGFNELRILTHGQKNIDGTNLLKFLDKLVTLNPSRQIGAKILEYFVELEDVSLLQEVLEKNSADHILQFLTEKRFPRTTLADNKASKQVQEFPWPSHVKAQWLRQGDRAGVEVKFFSSSSDDLKKKISLLNELKDKNIEKLWN